VPADFDLAPAKLASRRKPQAPYASPKKQKIEGPARVLVIGNDTAVHRFNL
jgi:hypothetical protein